MYMYVFCFILSFSSMSSSNCHSGALFCLFIILLYRTMQTSPASGVLFLQAGCNKCN